MKLTNQQIESLTNILVSEREKQTNTINEQRKKDAKLKASKRAKQLMILYNRLPVDLIKCIKRLRFEEKMSESKIIETLADYKKEIVHSRDYRNKVILASIECNDVFELKKKLKIEF